MTYTYQCTSCMTVWDASYSMSERNFPLTQPCPHCKTADTVKKIITGAPRISYDGAQTVLQRAGSGWNDLLNKVKKGSGRKTTIETR